jgi:hypothetical protein
MSPYSGYKGTNQLLLLLDREDEAQWISQERR